MHVIELPVKNWAEEDKHLLKSVILGLSLQFSAAEPPEELPSEPLPAEAALPEAEETDPVIVPETEEVAAPVVPRDTPVHLMVVNEVSTKKDAAGTVFKLRVNQPVLVDGVELIPVGTTAWGEVVEADSSGNVGKSGQLAARLTHIDLGGQRIPIEGETSAKGKSGKGETILGVLALGPLGLFAKGNNAKIKAGEKITAFVAQDRPIDAAD